MSTLWPRLAAPIARSLFSDLQVSDPPGRIAVAELRHPTATFASTGGSRASEADLRRVRDAIVATAERFGYPDRANDPIRFDREMAVALLEAMPMPEGEALVRDVWSHLALVTAPDVTYWRFVRNPGDTWNAERWVCTDRTRHMYARLWWQARQLTMQTETGRDTSLLDGLTESELNHLTERTTIGGYAPLVQALARAVISLPPERRQRDIVRQAALLLLRRTAVVDPCSLDPAQVQRLVDHAVADANRL